MEITIIKPKIYTLKLVPTKDDEEYGLCTYVRFIFDCDNGRLTINGDLGDYSYEWGFNKNEDFMHLMSRIDQSYLLSKLANRNIFNLEESKIETIKSIELSDLYYELEEDWTNIKNEILRCYTEYDESFYRKIESLIPSIDFETIRLEYDYPKSAQVACLLFTKYIQPYIKTNFQ